jgi:hypothetical protein
MEEHTLKNVNNCLNTNNLLLLRDICGLYYKTFRIVIYDHNDSTIVDPVL